MSTRYYCPTRSSLEALIDQAVAADRRADGISLRPLAAEPGGSAPGWLGAAGQATAHPLGTGVAAAPATTPPDRAGVATLERLFPGRAFLGIGSGEALNEVPVGDVAEPEQVARMDQALDSSTGFEAGRSPGRPLQRSRTSSCTRCARRPRSGCQRSARRRRVAGGDGCRSRVPECSTYRAAREAGKGRRDRLAGAVVVGGRRGRLRGRAQVEGRPAGRPLHATTGTSRRDVRARRGGDLRRGSHERASSAPIRRARRAAARARAAGARSSCSRTTRARIRSAPSASTASRSCRAARRARAGTPALIP